MTSRLKPLMALAIFSILLPATSGCGYGTRITVGNGAFYYTSNVTEPEALAASALLIKMGHFDEVRSSAFQLAKENRVYQLRVVVRDGVENDDGQIVPLRILGERMSKEALGSSPVELHLCDSKFRTLKVVPFSPLQPALPVEVVFRKSIGGGSLVAQYVNKSDKFLVVKAGLSNKTLHQAKSVVLSIKPRGTTEHGWAEGWNYASGDETSLYQADYEPLTVFVP